MDLDRLNKTVQELDQSSKTLKGYSDLFSELSTLHNSISANNDFFKLVSSKLENVSNSVDESLIDFQDTIKELDISLTSRLNKDKSDIQVELRNEGTQIQRAFENSLNSNFSKYESQMREELSEIESKINNNNILIRISLISGLTSIAMIIYLIITK